MDASALVKRYVAERRSRETAALTASAQAVGTALVSRAEVAAGVARAVRLGLLGERQARAVRRAMAVDWSDIARLPVDERLVERAEGLAWDHGLRGYDAIHLAAATIWQEAIGASVTLATFDRQLWEAGGRVGLAAWPEDLKASERV